MRKTWYHSCYTDSVHKSTSFLMLFKFRAARSHFFLSCEIKISTELARSCCQPKQRPSLCSIFLSVIGCWRKYDIGTIQDVPNRVLCMAAGLNWRPVLGKGVCSDSNRPGQPLCSIYLYLSVYWITLSTHHLATCFLCIDDLFLIPT